jgi:hypothetical protein
MSRDSDAVFRALFALEDVRELLRESAPKHVLDREQKIRLSKALDDVASCLKVLEALK